jgi:two-component system, NtrC family, response regulator
MLSQYPWPGNVRELRNVVERVVNLGEEALPEEMSAPIDIPRETKAMLALELPFKEAKERLIEGFERDYLKSLLDRCGGNISRAAREAGIARLYVRKLLKKHGLHGDDDP